MANIRLKLWKFWELALLASVGILSCSMSFNAARASGYGLAPDVKHMALIIGNADYDLDGTIRTGPTDVPAPGALKDLRNPCRDAELFKRKLLAARWKPEEITAPPCNQTADQMRDLITTFREAVVNASNTVVIFYFSGHGAQFSNEETSHSFLFGAGAKVDLDAAAESLRRAPGNTSFLASDAVDVHELIGTLGRQTENAVLLVLDACRENPLYDQIAELSPALRVAPISSNLEEFPGIVLAYSTPSGTFSGDGPGDHSIYTEAVTSLFRHSRNLDSLLNGVRATVADKYRRAYPMRTGIQEPVTRGRFAGDWCVWACPPVEEEMPVAEIGEQAQNAAAPADPLLAWLLPEEARRRPAADLFTTAAFQEAPAARPPSPRSSTAVPRTMTVFDKASQIKASPPAPPIATESPASVPSVPDRPEVSGEGMRFDVFWCEGGLGSEQRAIRAATIAADLAGEANESAGSKSVLSERLRSQISAVRVRALSQISNTNAGYRYKDDIVVFDPGIKNEVAWVYNVARITQPPLRPVGEGSQSTGYMSIFVCKGPAEYAELRSKLYLQVPQEDQKKPGEVLLRHLSNNIPGLNVMQGIESLSTAPSYTEVRFFYPEDRDNAFAAAAQLEDLLKRGVKVRYLSSLAEKTSPGVVEVWLGKLDPQLTVDEAGNLMSAPVASR